LKAEQARLYVLLALYGDDVAIARRSGFGSTWVHPLHSWRQSTRPRLPNEHEVSGCKTFRYHHVS
jgi:hypothetical protein